jgi:uncharacterized protein involved in type VI secretion and phage assembly
MSVAASFATPAWWMTGAHLGVVVSVADPMAIGRVKVTLLAPDSEGAAEIWARVAVPFAADNCGAFLIPDVGEEVVVVFVGNNADAPIVVGSLWNGSTAVPEAINDRVDRWTITGKAGTRIAIVESGSGQEKVEIETPAGVKATLTDASGQSLKLEAAGNTITMNTSGVSIDCAATVSISATKVEVAAGMVTVNAGISKFSGLVQCDTLLANSVISASYTPGAGNIW